MKWEDGRIGQEILFEGEKGTIIILGDEYRLWYVQFVDKFTWVFPSLAKAVEFIDPEILFTGKPGKITVVSAKADAFCAGSLPQLFWTYEYEAEPVEIVDAGKYVPGEKGWIPDVMRSDIDVLAVTEELVSVEVGK